VNIVAPISSVTELEMLLECGADELYCGLSTPEWEEHFGGTWWMNRRSPEGANMTSWEDLQTIVTQAHDAKTPVHVTLNTPFYTQGSVEYVTRLARRLAGELGVDSLIVSDLTLLTRLLAEGLPTDLHLSSLGSCTNGRSVGFYETLGIKRIILPRQLRIPEIEGIVTAEMSREMEFEIFAVNDGCYFEEGFCQTTHAVGSPFCLTDWEVRVHRSKGAVISSDEMAGHREDLREYLWFQNNCGSSIEDSGVPNGPCSLCWFGHFRDWGVTSVKIVGREASFYRKMRSLQLVKAVVDEVRRGASREAVAEIARSTRGTPEYCDKGYMCYFRGG
jgi:putative protease